MGWTYSNQWDSQKQVEKAVIDSMNHGGYSVIDKSSRWGELYLAVETPRNNNVSIAVVLIRKSDGEYGYKIMDESMGPYYYNCPDRILKLSTDSYETSIKWRAECVSVRGHRRLQKHLLSKLTHGDCINTSFGIVRFIRMFNKSGSVFVGENLTKNQVFRYPANCILP